MDGLCLLNGLSYHELMFRSNYMSNYTHSHSVTESFRSAMNDKGITAPREIYVDNAIHRFSIHGNKPRNKSAWYVMFSNRISSGAFGCWKLGVTYSWCEKNFQQMTYSEWVEHKKQIEEAQRKLKIEKTGEQIKAAERAQYIYNHLPSANSLHPYLIRKRIKSFSARQKLNKLILPIIDFERKIWSLQFISPYGSKHFLSNGAIKGHFIPIQGYPAIGMKHLICESFSTGATLAEFYPDACVLSACSAGNLESVAVNVRKNLPTAEIIICADDDRLNINNPGITKGRSAAIASGALFCQPKWPSDAPRNLTDFNDLFCWLAQKELIA